MKVEWRWQGANLVEYRDGERWATVISESAGVMAEYRAALAAVPSLLDGIDELFRGLPIAVGTPVPMADALRLFARCRRCADLGRELRGGRCGSCGDDLRDEALARAAAKVARDA